MYTSNMINECYVILADCHILDANKTMRDKWFSNRRDHNSDPLNVCMYKVHTITSNPFLRLNPPAVAGKSLNSIIHHFHSRSGDVSTKKLTSFITTRNNLLYEASFCIFIYLYTENNDVSRFDRVSYSSLVPIMSDDSLRFYETNYTAAKFSGKSIKTKKIHG